MDNFCAKFCGKIKKVFGVIFGVILRHKTIFLLAGIIIIACFFRLWKLNEIPPGLYPDVAINGNNALDTLQTNNFKVFYPDNNGREGLFMWLIAFSFKIFGVSVWSIKIVAAIVGILTVLGLYLLTKELFSRKIALLTSFFLAISFWHNNFSRIGFRAIMVPFFLVFGFYFLFRGIIKKRYLLFALSGLFFGGGVYTYISYRFAAPLLLIIFCYLFLIFKKENCAKDLLKYAAVLVIFAFLVSLPILIYFAKNPGDFFGRAGQVSILKSPNPALEFGKSLFLSLQMFNFYGDANWRQNFAGSPELLWPVGIFFLIGIIFSIQKLYSTIKKRDFSAGLPYFSLFLWFIFLILPSALSMEGIPHALRSIGAIPPVFIFAGLGAFKAFEFTIKTAKNKLQKILIYSCLFVFLFSLAFAEFDKYFSQWGQKQEVKDAFSEDYLKIGNFLNSLPENVAKYVLVNQDGVPVPYPNGIPMPAQTPMFIERAKYGKIRANYILPGDLDKIDAANGAIIVPLHYDENVLKDLWNQFPLGKIYNQNGVWFYKI